MNRKVGTLIAILAVVVVTVVAAVSYWLFSGLPGSETVLTAESVKKLVPAAAAMSTDDWIRLARSENSPTLDDFEDQCLTLLHLTLSISTPPAGNKTAQDTFRCLTEGPPKPASLVGEIQRTVSVGPLHGRSGLVTSLHYERITRCTCDVDGDVARGIVAFSVPGLYAGKVGYVATRQDGQWNITEFDLPGYGIKTVLGEDGVWKVEK